MKPELILVGGGGHCKSCIDVIECSGAYDIAGIVDVAHKMNHTVLDCKITATDEDLDILLKHYKFFLITIGQIKSPGRRPALFNYLKKRGARFPVIISPLAYVSKYARIEEGTIVMHHAIVNADVTIGKNCIINTGALIEHEALIGDHCHIATRAIVNGNGQVGNRTFVGSNSVCVEGIEVGADSIIGAGVKIKRDLPPGSFVK